MAESLHEALLRAILTELLPIAELGSRQMGRYPGPNQANAEWIRWYDYEELNEYARDDLRPYADRIAAANPTILRRLHIGYIIQCLAVAIVQMASAIKKGEDSYERAITDLQNHLALDETWLTIVPFHGFQVVENMESFKCGRAEAVTLTEARLQELMAELDRRESEGAETAYRKKAVLEILQAQMGRTVLKIEKRGDDGKALMDAFDDAEHYKDLCAVAFASVLLDGTLTFKTTEQYAGIAIGKDHLDISDLYMAETEVDTIYLYPDLEASLQAEDYTFFLTAIETDPLDRTDWQQAMLRALHRLRVSMTEARPQEAQLALTAAVDAVLKHCGVGSNQALKVFIPFILDGSVQEYRSELLKRMADARHSAAHGGSLKGDEYIMESSQKWISQALILLGKRFPRAATPREVVCKLKEELDAQTPYKLTIL